MEARYFGYVCNFATTQWFKLDDKEVEEVEEEDVLKNAQDKAYMLHYVLMGSEEYHQCYQEDISFCPSKGTSVSSSNLAIADKTIGETGKSTDKMMGQESTAADEIKSHSARVVLETGKEVSTKEGSSAEVTKSLDSTVVLETKEPSTKDSVSGKLSEGTKSQHTTEEGVSHQTAVLETMKELSTEGVTDRTLSTTQVLSQGTKSHPTTEYHPTPLGLETGKEPSTKEGAPDNLSEMITKSQPPTVA